MGTLYLVATPIGNLKDISVRAIKTLFDVDVIACEDTRRAGILLESLLFPYSVLVEGKPPTKPRFLSYYDQNELQRIPEIISMLQQGTNIALISDAGTPAISDPGFKLVRECAAQGLKVEAIPGASSVTTALILSGLPTDKFLFMGYPPHKSGHRITFLENIKKSQEAVNSTAILFEAPHKLLRTLEDMQGVLGDIPIVIARELTKIHQEIRRESISESLKHFKKNAPRGEIIILFHQ
jgi:16S rRNA (cytidine1402-2'-O)-methyltransferase